MEAFRPGTRANLKSNVLLYVAFAQRLGFRDFPASARGLLAFGECLASTYQTPKAVFNTLASVKHFHLDAGLATAAFEDRLVVLWRRALSTTIRTVSTPAPPLSPALLHKLCVVAMQLGTLGTVMTALMTVLYGSLARLSSLLPQTAGGFDASRHPCWGDLLTGEDGFRLHIKWGKTRQVAGQGYWVPLLGSPGSLTCPVEQLGRLRAAVGPVGQASPLFTWPSATGTGGGQQIPLSMPLARQWLRILLARAGESPTAVTFHSFRRGACTLAFECGATEGDLRQLGGWRSDAIKAYLPAFEARRRAADALRRGLGEQE